MRPTVICLCGSTKFKDDFLRVTKEQTLMGRIVLSVGFFGHADNEKIDIHVKAMLDTLHLAKIDLADEVLVINKNDYIGESTYREICYATVKGKKIHFMEETKHKTYELEHKEGIEIIS